MTKGRTSGIRSARLEELQAQHSEMMVTARDVKAAEHEYLSALLESERIEREMSELVKQQARIGAAKRELAEKHAEELSRMKLRHETAFGKLIIASAATAESIVERARQRREVVERTQAAAERLAIVNGTGPLELGGVVHDFQCYGPKVYLVPRGPRKAGKPAKPKRRGK